MEEQDYNMALSISTHTLTWSVTQWVLLAWQNFSISTHTLTWSVTTHFTTLTLYYTNFNSHAHVERDVWLNLKQLKVLKFQLTRSRGA